MRGRRLSEPGEARAAIRSRRQLRGRVREWAGRLPAYGAPRSRRARQRVAAAKSRRNGCLLADADAPGGENSDYRVRRSPLASVLSMPFVRAPARHRPGAGFRVAVCGTKRRHR